MPRVSAARLLDLWEAGLHQPRAAWAQALLAETFPELAPAELDALTVGARNARLRALRVALFGAHVTAGATCPQCGARVESEFDLHELPGAADPAEPAHEPSSSPAPAVLSADTCDLTYRLPTAGDLLALAGCREVAQAREVLLQRCVTAVRPGGGVASLESVAPARLAEVLAAMDRADPGAAVSLALSCPECGHPWSEPFDIVAFLWTEIDAWARRTIQDVHQLAQAYGWSEPEILNLSATRRAHYLELVGV